MSEGLTNRDILDDCIAAIDSGRIKGHETWQRVNMLLRQSERIKGRSGQRLARRSRITDSIFSAWVPDREDYERSRRHMLDWFKTTDSHNVANLLRRARGRLS